MSLLDRVRTTVDATRGTVDALRDRGQPRESWAAGAIAAAVPWLAVVALAGFVRAGAPGGNSSGWQVLALGSAGWVLGTGGSLGIDGIVVGISPILVWVAAVWFAAYRLRRLADDSEEAARHVLLGFLGGYAALAALACLVTLAGPARPTLTGLPGLLSVPLVAAGIVLWRGDEDLADRMPPWVRRAAGPAVRAGGALAAVATALLLVMTVVRWPTISSLHAAVGADGVQSIGLILVQTLFAPDLAVWALSFLAGPGFQIAAGGTVSVSGSAPGLLPMIPVLGVVPGTAQYPGWLTLALLVPVAIGGYLTWEVGRRWSRLARWQDTARTTAAAIGMIGLAVLTAGLLAGGPVGSTRLIRVGPDPWALTFAVVGELTLGAALVLVVTLVQRRRRG